MTKYAKDPGLNELAAKLKTLTWIHPIPADEADTLYRDATAPTSSEGAYRSHVSPMPNYVDWAVRMYLGGEQRTLGLAKTKELPYALRFADMAQMYFWKYRVRGAAPPTEQQLNRSLADVESDMVNEPHALALLGEIEGYLLRRGVLKTADQRDADKKKRKSRSIRSMVAIQHAATADWFDGLRGKLDELAKQLEAVREVQRAQLEVLQQIAKMVAAK